MTGNESFLWQYKVIVLSHFRSVAFLFEFFSGSRGKGRKKREVVLCFVCIFCCFFIGVFGVRDNAASCMAQLALVAAGCMTQLALVLHFRQTSLFSAN